MNPLIDATTTKDTAAKQIWPPPYTLRRSTKARNILLQITKSTGLEIVVPIRQKKLDVEQLLNEKRHWIERTLRKMAISLESPSIPIAPLPHFIYCQAIGESFSVVYQDYPTKKIKLITSALPNKILWIKGDIQHSEICKKHLRLWLIKLAKLHLIPWLRALSIEKNLPFNHAIVRGQSTLWGSCNSKKNISLNYKLLFLPQSLAEHVLLHELCHTKYLNHSDRFWNFLGTFDKNCAAHKRLLRAADRYVPPWLLPL